VGALNIVPRDIAVWIGPAIGPFAFEVGRDVYDTFCGHDPAATACFVPRREGKWLADLAGLARQRLAALHVHDVTVHGGCTYADPARYFSYRRDGTTGRMALTAWINAPAER
jgi:copper oxidase (laccase) domain-containing protein